MRVQDMVKTVMAIRNVNSTELAKRLDTSRQSLNKHFVRDSFSFELLESIGEQLDIEFFYGFRFPDGREITSRDFASVSSDDPSEKSVLLS